MTRAFAYLRVSGKGQIEGDGFERQLAAILEHCRVHELELAGVFREEGVSGSKELENRPALLRLLAALEDQGVEIVVVEKLDRLARDLMVQETIISDMQRNGYTLVSALEPDLCSEDPSRKLVRQIFGAIAEYERAMIVLKLRGARQRKKAREGRCEGQKPYGLLPGEAGVLAEMLDLRASGATAFFIAAHLNHEGLRTRAGRLWHPATVAKILAREARKSSRHTKCAEPAPAIA